MKKLYFLIFFKLYLTLSLISQKGEATLLRDSLFFFNTLKEIKKADQFYQSKHQKEIYLLAKKYQLKGWLCDYYLAMSLVANKRKDSSMYIWALKAIEFANSDFHKAKSYCQLISLYALNYKINESKPYLDQLKKIASSSTNNAIQYEYNLANGIYLFKLFDSDASLFYFDAMLNYAISLNDNEKIAIAKTWIFHAQHVGLNPIKKYNYIFEGLNYFKSSESSYEPIAHHIIGRAYLSIGNYEKAFFHIKESTKLFQLYNCIADYIKSNLSLVEVSILGNDFITGHKLIEQSLIAYNKLKYPPILITIHLTKAKLLSSQKEHNIAKVYFNIADSLLKIYDFDELKLTYWSYLLESQYKQGFDFISKKVIDSSSAIQSKLLPKYMIKRLINRAANAGLFNKEQIEDLYNYTQKGETDSTVWGTNTAISSFNQYTGNYIKKDSDYAKAFNNQLIQAETEYNTNNIKDSLTKSKYEARLTKSSLQNQKLATWLIAVSALALSIIAYLLLRSKKRAIADKKEILLLKEEANHRVKNMLEKLQAIMLQIKGNNPFSDIPKLEQRLIPMIKLYNLLGVSQEDRVNMKDYLTQIANDLQSIYDIEKKVNIDTKASVELEGEKALSVGIIVNELLTNSFKYAFSNVEQCQIKVVCTRKTNSEIYLLTEDNGPGIADSKSQTHNGEGLKHIDSFVHKLRGTKKLDTNNGFKFELWFY